MCASDDITTVDDKIMLESGSFNIKNVDEVIVRTMDDNGEDVTRIYRLVRGVLRCMVIRGHGDFHYSKTIYEQYCTPCLDSFY